MRSHQVISKIWRSLAFFSFVPVSSFYLYASAQTLKQSRPNAVSPVTLGSTHLRTAKQYVDTVENGLDYLRISMRDIRDAYERFESKDLGKAEFHEQVICAEKGLLLYANSLCNVRDMPVSCQSSHYSIARLAEKMIAQNQMVLDQLEQQNSVRPPKVMLENIRIVREIGIALTPAIKQARQE